MATRLNFIGEVCSDTMDQEMEDLQDKLYKLNFLPAEEEHEEYMERKILCIDIGVINLGLSVVIADREYNFIDIVGVDLVDMTTFLHREGTTIKNCCLYHERTFTDWLEHVFLFFKEVFDGVDLILIELQPPQGFKAVEQLIFSKYRHKSYLVHPRSVHSFFSIGKLDYEQRKDAVEVIARKHLNGIDVLKEFNSFFRKHDIADSICIGLYWLNKANKEYMIEQKRIQVNKSQLFVENKVMTTEQWFEQFRYKG
jgi:hypothetical protein